MLRFIGDLQNLSEHSLSYYYDKPETIKSVLLAALASNYREGDENAVKTLKDALTEAHRYTHGESWLDEQIEELWVALNAQGTNALEDKKTRRKIYMLIINLYDN